MTISFRFGFFMLVLLLAFSCKKGELNSIVELDSIGDSTSNNCYSNPSNPVFNLTTNDFNNHLPVNYDSTLCGIFPLSKNYKWIYRDSVFGNNGQFLKIEYDTLFVEKMVKFPGSEATWWKLKSKLGKQVAPNNYIYTTDSVMYFLEQSGGYSQNSNYTLYSNKTWLRLDGQQFGVITDMAYINKYFFQQKVKVPAGIYNNSIRCDKMFYGMGRIFFKPGVGFLKIEFYNSISQERNKLLRVSELVAFIH